MKTTTLTLILLLPSFPAFSQTPDDSMRVIFQGHRGIIQELAKDYVEGEDKNLSDLPNQKNTPLQLKIVTHSQTPAPAPPPIKHDYSTNTVWANVKAHVTDFHGRFSVGVESDTPVDGWIIKRMGSQDIVAKGGENSAFNFTFTVNENFNNDYSITVMVDKDGETNPALIPLN